MPGLFGWAGTALVFAGLAAHLMAIALLIWLGFRKDLSVLRPLIITFVLSFVLIAAAGLSWHLGRQRAGIAPAPPGEGQLRLVARWHSLAWPGKPDPDTQVHVLLDGREVGTLTAHPSWGDAALDLPDISVGDKNGVVVIELLTSVARPPGGETRYLGVAIDRIRLERGSR